MSLATRCTACDTAFRVVQDQLKVSEGWVRCGRCNEVFNALEGLFDLERDLPVDAAGNARSPAASALDDAPVQAAPKPMPEPAPEPPADMPAMPSPSLDADAQPMPPTDRWQASADAGLPAPSTPFRNEAEEPPLPTPNFLRETRTSSRWQSPRARAALWALLLLLGVAVSAQAAHHFRDLIAARWPLVKPALTAWCGVVGCTVGPARRIEDIAVESTALTRAAGPDAFRLAVVLRNRGALALAMPSLELSLTDSGGQLIARRALAASEFRAAPSTLAPGAEASLQATLATGSSRVTGYTVEVFYP